MIRVNWNQGKVASDGHIRVHKVMPSQHKLCQFEGMKGDYSNYEDVQFAESAIKKKGYTTYKHCSHCWDGKVIYLTP